MHNTEVNFLNFSMPEKGTAVFTIYEDLILSPSLKELDADGLISKSINAEKKFKGKVGEQITILSPANSSLDRIIVLGLGDVEKLGEKEAMKAGASITKFCNVSKLEGIQIVVDLPDNEETSELLSLALPYGMSLENYHFNKYFVNKKDSHELYLNKVDVYTRQTVSVFERYQEFKNIQESVFLARNLASEPGNVLYPQTFAERCQELEEVGLKIKVLGEKEMERLGMNSLLAVGQGSENESHLAVLEWRGAGDEQKQPYGFVGKGVTFDTGGINLKPSSAINDMKYDMCGAATVVGLMHALAKNHAPVNAVGVIGLVENMPSGNAQRPDDVVTSMSGQTIEVINTDAEGRMVLADCLTYIQRKYSPEFIVDLATLTGAIVVALGDIYAGLFSNNDELVRKLEVSGNKTGELVWRMPVGGEYDAKVDSVIADVRNTGNDRGAGSITAAQFLYRFIEEELPWMHLDIAAVEWAAKGKACYPKGATGYGVRLLYDFVQNLKK